MTTPRRVADKAPRIAAKKLAPRGAVFPFPRKRFMTFLENLDIQSRDFGLTKLQLLGTQRYVLDEICKGVAEGVTTFVILKARQIGISTLLLALDVFWAFEYGGTLGVFVTHDEAARDQFKNQITLYLQTLPKNYKVDDKTHNRNILVFLNNSLFQYRIAGQRQNTNRLGRSGGSNYGHMTEVAFWGSAEDIKSLGQSFSKLHPHRLYFWESTANGFNHFTDMCENAQNSPAQRFIFVPWWRNELYEFDAQHPLYPKYMAQGTKTPLTKREREGVKAVRDQFGIKITAGQIAWYRNHMETECGGDQSTMDQEMPWVPDDAFQSTGSAFFTDESLTAQMREARKVLCMPFVFKLTKLWEDTQLASTNIERAELKIWEEPSPFGYYFLGDDPAYGSSPDSDNNCISIFRGFADCCYQVAEYASRGITSLQNAWILAYLAGLYGNVMVNLELTGPGQSTFAELEELRQRIRKIAAPDGKKMGNVLGHMKHFLYRKPDSLAGSLVRQWRTTQDNADAMLSLFKGRVELGTVAIRSVACIKEMQRCKREGGGIEMGGLDRMVAAGLAHYAWFEWGRPKLQASGHTLGHALSVEKTGGEHAVNVMMRRFMHTHKIKVGDTADVDVTEA